MIIEPDPQALLAAEHSSFDLGGERVAVIRGRDGETLLVDPNEAELLSILRRPHGEAELGRALRSRGWEAVHRSWIAEVLEGFGEGWVDTLEGHFARARAAAAASAPRPRGSGFDYLAWPTKDRPAAVARAMEAWSKAFETDREPEPAAIVADDSVDGGAATRAAILGQARRRGAPVHLLDAAFRARFAEALSSVDAEAARFAIAPEPDGRAGNGRYGANRNLIVLAASGSRLLMGDDDVLPEFRARPDSEPGLGLAVGGDPTTIRPFASANAMDRYGLPHSPAMSHFASLLGSGVLDLAENEGLIEARAADSTGIGRALAPASRIAAFCCGVWGDSGMANSRYLLTARERLDPESLGDDPLEELFASRLLFRAPRRLSLGGAYFMGFLAGFDLEEVLPPFIPMGRGEDTLWAATLASVAPELLIATPREAVRHSPLAPREADPANSWNFVRQCNDYLAAFIAILRLRDETAHSLESLGARLSAIATLPPAAFARTMADSLAQHFSLMSGRMENLLRLFGGESEAWDTQMAAALGELRELPAEPFWWLPREFADDAEGYRRHVGRYGRLLEVWPALRERAAAVGPDLLEGAKIRS